MKLNRIDESAPVRRSYGSQPSQYGEYHQAVGPDVRGVVILVHGGFWRAHRGLEMTTPAATLLADRGWHVWNIEYRRGGPWRQTLDDCVRAYEHICGTVTEIGSGLFPTLLVGHSAGGQLAAWLAGVQQTTGRLDGLVTLNGVVDLELAHRLRIGDSAVAEFLGPDGTATALAAVDPAQHLPAVPIRCLHSRNDERVPFEISASYVSKARETDRDIALIEASGPHSAAIEPGSVDWSTVLAAIEAPWTNHEDEKGNT